MQVFLACLALGWALRPVIHKLYTQNGDGTAMEVPIYPEITKEINFGGPPHGIFTLKLLDDDHHVEIFGEKGAFYPDLTVVYRIHGVWEHRASMVRSSLKYADAIIMTLHGGKGYFDAKGDLRPIGVIQREMLRVYGHNPSYCLQWFKEHGDHAIYIYLLWK